MSIRDTILQQDSQREFRDVTDIPNWPGVTVRLQALSASERDAFESSVERIGPKGQRVRNTHNVRARLVALCLVDQETGQRVFTSPEDVQALGNKSAKALDYLWDIAAEMNGLTPESRKALEGNSDETDGDGTPTM